MTDEYPLYPSLTDEGKEEVQKIMDSFKPKIKRVVNDLLDDLYTDVSYYVESDHWTNYRNKLMNGLCNYDFDKQSAASYDFKRLRQAIYNNNKEEITKDLNQDLVKENEDLKSQLSFLRRSR